MLDNFTTHISKNLNFLSKSKLLIASSGGLDSVVLTHLCHTLKLNIALAHCNFNLRGKESDEDEGFVIDLADELNLEVFVEHFDTKSYAKTEKVSIQMAARELRYDWFSDLAKAFKFDYILTAHHADDNIETFLINLTRGTGLKGLTGIPEVNNNIVRPLLPFSRDELESYAKANHLKWRDDSSNASDKYLRNKLRHHVIPVLKETTPELLQNFKNTLKHLNASAEIIDDHIAAVTENAIDYIDDNQIKFKISEIKNTKNPKAYLYEMFQVYGFTQWNDVVKLLDAQSGKQILSDTHRLVKNREHLILTALRNDDVIQSDSDESISILESDKMVETPFGTLHINQVDVISKSLESTVYVDKSKLKFPLGLRHWKEGDVFYPLGMTGKKKLSKYFKDEKYSIIDKENAWLLCSGDDIVWVVGKRADERYKVTNSTTYILKIELENLQIT